MVRNNMDFGRLARILKETSDMKKTGFIISWVVARAIKNAFYEAIK